MAGDYLISTALYDRSFSEKLDSAVVLAFADDADVAAATKAVEQVLTRSRTSSCSTCRSSPLCSRASST
jgi:hypothetical protein